MDGSNSMHLIAEEKTFIQLTMSTLILDIGSWKISFNYNIFPELYDEKHEAQKKYLFFASFQIHAWSLSTSEISKVSHTDFVTRLLNGKKWC